MNRLLLTGLTLAAWLLALPLHGQISSGGIPFSFTAKFQNQYGNRTLRTHRIAPINAKRARQEEDDRRFTRPQSVDFGLDNAGQWLDLENGDGLWRLKIRSRGALGLAVLYDRFYLPPGARLYMYSEDGDQLIGAYTSRNNRSNGKFMTGLIEGESAVLEYYEPAAVAGQGRLHIYRIDRAFRGNFQSTTTRSGNGSGTGFGAAKGCQQNAACLEGGFWQDHQRSICRIITVFEEGMGFCTGTLVNNTEQDGTPYLLTAFHCQDGYTPLYDFWRFDFGYRSSTCGNPAEEPAFRALLGCSRVAGRQENDMLLLEAQTVIPETFDLYYAGWDRREAVPGSARNFHHPVGDIMKVATIDGGITIFGGSIQWNNEVTTPPNHHFDMTYTSGTFELGSSGSPLFNSNGLVVGQLHGGNPDCAETQAWFGRLALAWEGGGTPETRLKDWLDPLGTGTEIMPGTSEIMPGLGTLSGVVQTEEGKPVEGVRVELSTLTGDTERTVFTNAEGRYAFEDIPLRKFYGLRLSRTGDDINGLSTLDLINIRKHILGIDRLGSPYKMLAADVNLSNSISTLDIIKIQKVILGIRLQFEEGESWRFIPRDFVFSDPLNPFLETIIPTHYLSDFTDDVLDFNFLGIKAGDVNGNAETGL